MYAGFRMFKIGQDMVFTFKENIVQQIETEMKLKHRILVAYEMCCGRVWQRERKAQFGWLVKFSQNK